MKKRTWIWLGVILVVAAGTMVILLIHSLSNSGSGALENGGKPVDAIRTKQALALPKDESCLLNRASAKTAAEKQPGLSEETGVWTGEILDVPAGTQVQVNVATYAGGTVTGSLHYPVKYGSYNFTLHKQPGGWYFTRFIGCH